MNNNNLKKKRVPIIYGIVSIILGIISLLLMWYIIKLDILSTFFLILVILFIVGISLLSIFISLKSRIKKIGVSISIILIVIFSVLLIYIYKTANLFDDVSFGYKTYNYSIIVLRDSFYDNINDLEDLSIGFIDDSESEIDNALDKVSEKVEFVSVRYEDSNKLGLDLLNDELDGILIDDGYLDILDDNIIVDDLSFNEYVRKIYSFKLKVNMDDVIKDINVTKEMFNIYLSGIDTYGSISSVARSDVNMVVSINPNTNQILLTSIPRDYYVELNGMNNAYDKLTHAGLYGIDTSVKTIEDLLDIEINYYLKVNFSSVIDIIDAIGGINVYSDYDFVSRDNYSYVKGYNKVNGMEALSFARERKAFAAGDRQRVRNQQAVFEAIFDKCMSKDIVTKYVKVLDSIKGSFVTNMPMSRITSLIKLQLSKNNSWNIVSNSLEGTDGNEYTYSTPRTKSYVMIPSVSNVMYSSKLIDELKNDKVIDDDLIDNIVMQVNGEISSGEELLIIDNRDKGLRTKLVRNNITLIEGEEFVYHGFSATYDGEEISDDDDLEVRFVIDDKVFDDYKELVRYITYNLNRGNYTIIYNISYKGENQTLKQVLIIK